MLSLKNIRAAQIPVILTVLLVVGTAWSWVAEMNRTKTSEDVQTRLANFALDGQDQADPTSLPACCMTLEQADTAEATLLAAKRATCEGCPGSGSSLSVADEGAPSCCPGSTTSVADTANEEGACCAGSASSKTSVTETEALDPETEAMIATVKIPQVGE